MIDHTNLWCSESLRQTPSQFLVFPFGQLNTIKYWNKHWLVLFRNHYEVPINNFLDNPPDFCDKICLVQPWEWKSFLLFMAVGNTIVDFSALSSIHKFIGKSYNCWRREKCVTEGVEQRFKQGVVATTELKFSLILYTDTCERSRWQLQIWLLF